MSKRLPVVFAACASLIAATSAKANGGRAVRVGTVEQLYAAVNDPHNDGARILLAPGSYLLSEAGHPNLGRLTLRQGMELIGQDALLTDRDGVPVPRDGENGETYAAPRTETIIDGSALLGDDTSGAGSRGVIESGMNNRIQGLTVIGNDETTATITVGLYPKQGGMSLEIVGCVLEGGRRGVQLATGGGAGTLSTILVEGNVLRHHRAEFGFGIQLLQFSAVEERLVGTLIANRFYDNNEGLFLPMLGSSRSETAVVSANNVYQYNSAGIVIIGSRDFGLPEGQPLAPGVPFPDSSGDKTWLDSFDDLIANNVDVNGGVGVYVNGASRDCPPPGAGDSCYLGPPLGPNGGDISNTQVHMSFEGARFIHGSGDQNGAPGSTAPWAPARSDFQVINEWSDYGSLAGLNNVTTLSIRNSVSDGAIGALQTAATDPGAVDTSGTNQVFVTEQHNHGVPAPTPYLGF